MLWFPWGGVGVKGFVIPGWPYGYFSPKEALARDGLHVYLLVSLSRVETGPTCLNIKGRQQDSKHRRDKSKNSAQGLGPTIAGSHSSLRPNLTPVELAVSSPEGSLIGL